jgi:predicted  nucleic acid-binding Zn-ribbon protein
MESEGTPAFRRPVVDHATYQRWWQLHLRLARGQSLSADEQSAYDAGRRALEQDELLRETAEARQLRAQLAALESEHGELQRRRAQLEGEIAELEARLSEQTREFLGVEE